VSVAGLSLADIVGFVGVGLVVATYFLSQIGRMDARRPAYPGLNALGALLILVSLWFRPNPASIAIEGFWLAISLIGFFRALIVGRRK
jgi:hypothetical protein